MFLYIYASGDWFWLCCILWCLPGWPQQNSDTFHEYFSEYWWSWPAWCKIQDIKWLQTITSLPILMKGILTAEDSECLLAFSGFCISIHLMWAALSWNICKPAARIAIESGAAGIIVSNHGGRQLDHAPATISCLEEVCCASRPHGHFYHLFFLFKDSNLEGKFRLSEKQRAAFLYSTEASAVALTCSRPWH
jgi:hypothetical protein